MVTMTAKKRRYQRKGMWRKSASAKDASAGAFMEGLEASAAAAAAAAGEGEVASQWKPGAKGSG